MELELYLLKLKLRLGIKHQQLLVTLNKIQWGQLHNPVERMEVQLQELQQMVQFGELEQAGGTGNAISAITGVFRRNCDWFNCSIKSFKRCFGKRNSWKCWKPSF